MSTCFASSRMFSIHRHISLTLGVAFWAFACSSTTSSNSDQGSGGSTATTGGESSGGMGGTYGGSSTTTGGVSFVGTGGLPVNTGGTAVGGTTGTGGFATGGVATGGVATGGVTQNTGGVATGGVATGGRSMGGRSAGGRSNGGGTSAGGATAGGGASAGGSTAAGGASAGGSTAAGGGSATGGSSTEGRSAGCGKTPTIPSSQYNNGSTISITAANKQRRYILNVPTNYDNNKAYKLILAIHELNGNDKEMYSQKYYNLLPESNDTTIFAAPNGTQSSGSPCTGTGSGDGGCGWPSANGDNMALMDAVVAQVEENFCVDTNHIFATGWSYGASMSYEVGCARPLGGTGSATWGVRAIAIYSGAQMSGNCKPSTPIGFYGSHGTHDSVLQYNGGVSLAQNFAQANGCTWATPPSASGAHICTEEQGCKDGYPVVFCSFNGDHTPYPDNGQMQGSWQAAVVWDFFDQF